MIDGFIVYDTRREQWVEAIDTVDGSTDYTSNKKHARIFRGQGWVDVWGDRPNYRLETPPITA